MESLKVRINEWLKFCRRNFTSETTKQYRSIAKMLLEHIATNGKLLTQESIEGFLCSKLEQGGSRTQWNCYLIAIRNFAKYQQQKYNVPSPAHKIQFLKQDPPRQRVLSEKEYQLCLQHTSEMDQDILIFLANTGLRREEFRKLKWADIDPQLKFVRILGKGRKQRIVPLNENCREILQKYPRLSVDEYLQISQRYPGGEGASWLCRRISKQLDIPIFGVHALRHRFATMMIRRGVNIYKLSKILGHASVVTTEHIYLHLVPQDLLGLTDCLED